MLEDEKTGGFGVDYQGYLAPLIKNYQWVKFLGAVTFIGGVLTCLTIIGILVGWVSIWLGALLWGSGNCLKTIAMSNDEDEAVELIEKLGTYFKVTAIFVLVLICFWPIVIILTLLSA